MSDLGVAYERLKILIELGNPEAIALAVQEGIGVGFVSSIIITKLLVDGVRVVKVRGLDLERDIYLGRHARRIPTVAQTAFWESAIGPGAIEMADPALQEPDTLRVGVF